MFTKDPALMALSRIRSFLFESAHRRLSVAEIKDLAGAMVLLCNSVGEDAWALRHIEAIERGLQMEFDDRWPGSNARREDLMLDTHALSGHIRSL